LSLDRGGAPDAGVQPATPPPATPTAQTVLLMGLDAGPGPRADSVVLARVDGQGAVNVVSLPRDLQVEIPGVGPGKLNSAYSRAYEAAAGQDADAAGARATVEVVEAFTGVPIDHYAAVEMAGFAELSAAVGGVEVCLRAAVRDEFSGVDLPAGRQTIQGEQALAFLRQRVGLPHHELDRVTRHQVFLNGLVAKAASVSDPAKLAPLLELARSSVHVDPSWDLPEFLRLLAQGPRVRTATIPHDNQVTTEAGAVLTADQGEVRAFLGDFLTARPGVTPVPSPGEPTAVDGCVN
ncbi:LCP family protein, partial [Saccharothrix hoggarensis]